MGMPESLRERFSLYAKLSVHRRRVAESLVYIREWLDKAKSPYISFSGGKDSLAVLHLVRSVRPDVQAVYWDAQCAFPECSALIDETPHCIRYPTDEPFLDTLERYGVHGGSDLENATMKTTVYGPVRRFLADYPHDGCAYGLRQEESRGRRMNGRTKGGVFWSKAYGVWMCQPIHQWSYNDVWAYIVSHNIPYCGTYDRMWEMPEREQRISYWAGETNRQYGRWAWLKRHYPDLYLQFRQRFPGASSYT